MIKHNQVGAVSGLGISLVFCIVFLLGSIGFGGWAYLSRQDYKDNVDQKVAAAVTVAKQEEASRKDTEFVEKEKLPYRTYNGPAAYGSLVIQYPKTWSGTVDDTGRGNASVDGYFYPGIVPAITDQNSTFALRVQVVNQKYSDVLRVLQGLQKNREKPTSVSPYALPKVPNVGGVRVTGGLPNQKTGEMIVLPLRAQTLQIWTEGDRFTGDFNTAILPNFSFSP